MYRYLFISTGIMSAELVQKVTYDVMLVYYPGLHTIDEDMVIYYMQGFFLRAEQSTGMIDNKKQYISGTKSESFRTSSLGLFVIDLYNQKMYTKYTVVHTLFLLQIAQK